MSIQIEGMYRNGVIHPNQPLDLPENTPVSVVVPIVKSPEKLTREEIIAMRPKAPRFTGEQLDAILQKHSISVGSLPADFSREDIYSDHD